jgi:hypothetical protein
MSSTTECSHCRGLAAGAATRCSHCGKWIRSQDFYPTAGNGPTARSAGRPTS